MGVYFAYTGIEHIAVEALPVLQSPVLQCSPVLVVLASVVRLDGSTVMMFLNQTATALTGKIKCANPGPLG